MKPLNSIIKSTRHQKVIGNYGELLICNWLSRSNFEVLVVDHTGIDIIAYNRKTKERFGITVKSRTRLPYTENSSVTIFKNKQDQKKVINACEAFSCEPWLAVYVETEKESDIYLTSLNNYNHKYRTRTNVVSDWKMSRDFRVKYDRDPNLKHIHIDFTIRSWW